MKERKNDALQKFDEGGEANISQFLAGNISISRSELAEWDAAARACFRAADEVMSVRQAQLLLIIDNISLPVSFTISLYASVIKTWAVTLETMERLIYGTPYAIMDGSMEIN